MKKIDFFLPDSKMILIDWQMLIMFENNFVIALNLHGGISETGSQRDTTDGRGFETQESAVRHDLKKLIISIVLSGTQKYIINIFF